VNAVLSMRVHHRVFLFGRRELPDGAFLVIDPYDGVIMRHGIYL
jgi:hypothetical protein